MPAASVLGDCLRDECATSRGRVTYGSLFDLMVSGRPKLDGDNQIEVT